MNWLKGTSVYLAGPIEHCNQAADWRDVLCSKLHSYDIEVLDPIKKPKWTEVNGNYDVPKFFEEFNKELESGLEDRSSLQNLLNRQHYDRHVCLRCVSSADFVICRFPKKLTIGTLEELTLASQHRKPVIIYGPDGIAGKWLMSLFDYMKPKDVFYDSEEEVIKYLDEIDKGEMYINPLPWIFLTYTKNYPNLRID